RHGCADRRPARLAGGRPPAGGRVIRPRHHRAVGGDSVTRTVGGLRRLVVGLVVLSLAACDGGGRPDRNAMSPAAYFNAIHADTETPHGRIKPGSAKDVAGGKIRYETKDGRAFEVSAVAEGNGYRYG